MASISDFEKNVDALYSVLEKKNISGRFLLLSFDYRTVVDTKYPAHEKTLAMGPSVSGYIKSIIESDLAGYDGIITYDPTLNLFLKNVGLQKKQDLIGTLKEYDPQLKKKTILKRPYEIWVKN